MMPMNRIVIQLFHPLLHKSRVNRALRDAVNGLEGVTIRIMYDLYPDFHIDGKEEQKVMLDHDIMVWQHPFYWYSSPALLKEWIDIVLEHGFAYGREGKALAGMKVLSAISAGGSRQVYQADGDRGYTVRQLLAPFEQTALLCNMEYLPPFMVHGTHLLDETGINRYAESYRKTIIALRDDNPMPGEWAGYEYMNDLIN